MSKNSFTLLSMNCQACKRSYRGASELSNREAEVVAQAITGKSSKEIAGSLFVTEKTVKFHLTNIYKKLGVKQRPALLAKWYSRQMSQEVVDLVNQHLSEQNKQLPPPPPIQAEPSFVEVEELTLPTGEMRENS